MQTSMELLDRLKIPDKFDTIKRVSNTNLPNASKQQEGGVTVQNYSMTNDKQDALRSSPLFTEHKRINTPKGGTLRTDDTKNSI